MTEQDWGITADDRRRPEEICVPREPSASQARRVQAPNDRLACRTTLSVSSGALPR